MPRAGVWLIRFALAHLASAAIVGAGYLAFKAYGWFPAIAAWRAAHAEQMLMGFMVQLVMGVAWWILPRTERAGGAERPERAAFIWFVPLLLNAGVIMAALGTMPGATPPLVTAGRSAEAAAAALFALLAWNRQRPYRATTRRPIV